MKYALLIYGPEPDPRPADEQEAEMPLWYSYTEQLEAAKSHLGGEALQPTESATTVREREGQRLVTDGPFAETKEILGGFYLIDVDDLDAALEWAAKIPRIDHYSVEVRPVVEFPSMPEAG